jgi:hypothetical protein
LANIPIAERVNQIADLLAVSRDSAERWSKEARQFERQQQQEKAWDLWLNCYSERDVAEVIGVTQPTINGWLDDKKSAHAENLSPPESRQHFTHWNFHMANGDSSYFGKMPPQIVENLLWFYTAAGDIVVDPFAGGGTTIDVAKAMGRRVWASDLNPSSELRPIHKHNILDGWPSNAPDKAKLILLDPPYWQQAKGRYNADDPRCLSNMSLDQFYDAWAKIISTCRAHLDNNGGMIAYIIGQTMLEGGKKIDHATDMLEICKTQGLHVRDRIIVPYQTEQVNGAQVKWAQDNKQLLNLYRDLIVLRHHHSVEQEDDAAP